MCYFKVAQLKSLSLLLHVFLTWIISPVLHFGVPLLNFQFYQLALATAQISMLNNKHIIRHIVCEIRP